MIKTILALGVALGTILLAVSARACEMGDKSCTDRVLLAAAADPREIAEGDAVLQRFKLANPLHCPPLDAMHPGRCDGEQDGPVVWGAALQALQRLQDEMMATHTHACQQGYAIPGTCK